jgi:hypothetical protein
MTKDEAVRATWDRVAVYLATEQALLADPTAIAGNETVRAIAARLARPRRGSMRHRAARLSMGHPQ